MSRLKALESSARARPGAEAGWAAILQIHPNHVEALDRLARLKFGSRQFYDAAALFRRRVDLMPTDHTAAASLVLALVNADQEDSAIEMALWVISETTPNPNAYYLTRDADAEARAVVVHQLAHVYRKRGEVHEALAVLKVIDLANIPKSLRTRWWQLLGIDIAATKYGCGDRKGALESADWLTATFPATSGLAEMRFKMAAGAFIDPLVPPHTLLTPQAQSRCDNCGAPPQYRGQELCLYCREPLTIT